MRLELAQRVALLVSVVVGVTALAVGASVSRVAALGPAWVLVVGVLVATGCVVGGHALARWWIGAWLGSLRAISEEIRSGRSGVAVAPDLAALVRAANERASRWDAERDALDARLRLLEDWLECTPDGVLVVDRDGTVAVSNQALREMFRMRPGGAGVAVLEAVRSIEVHDAAVAALRGAPFGPIAVVLEHRDLAVRGYPFSGGGFVLVHDMTDQRRLERARSAFVANVSHELRTPLASIAGWTEALLDQPLPDEARPRAEAIARGASRLRALFEDLLELVRIESRTSDVPLVPLALWPVLEDAALPSVEAALDKDQEFVMDGPEGTFVRGNAEAIRVIVRNLTSNAVRYTQRGGHISLTVEALGAEVVVRVRDDGLGIAPEHHERVFERFYRVDEGRSREEGGTGLGLAIVKHLAQATAARVTLTSALGHGATFSLYLPAADRPEPWR